MIHASAGPGDPRTARAAARGHGPRAALAALLVAAACSRDAATPPAPDARVEPPASPSASDDAAPSSPRAATGASPLWTALAALDWPAAREHADGDEERAFVTLLGRALREGSRAVEDELCALGAGAAEQRVRRHAGQTLLDLLRVEGRWEALAALPDRCPELPLGEGALPAGLLVLPREHVDVPDAPVPLAMLDSDLGLAVVTARIEGAGDAEEVATLIDTGATTCLVTDALARRLGIRRLGEARVGVAGGTGGRVLGAPAAIDRLALGGVRARDVPVVVLDDGAMASAVADVPLVLGWEVLQHLAVEIAGPRGEVVLRRGEPRETGGGDLGAPDAQRSDLVLLAEPLVRVWSDGVPLLFLLDTGANASDVTPGLVERLGLGPPVARVDAVRGLGGAGAASRVPVVEALPLRVGELALTIRNVAVLEASEDPRRLLRVDGTLGVDLGMAARLVVDGPGRRVELRAP